MKNTINHLEIVNENVILETINGEYKEIAVDEVISLLKDIYDTNDEDFLMEELENNTYYIIEKFIK